MAFCVEGGGGGCVKEREGKKDKKKIFIVLTRLQEKKKLQLLRFLYLRQSYVAKCKIKFKKTKDFLQIVFVLFVQISASFAVQ